MTTQRSSERRGNVSLLLRAVDPVMLFFDLVYVFLINELNGVIREESGWRGLAHAESCRFSSTGSGCW